MDTLIIAQTVPLVNLFCQLFFHIFYIFAIFHERACTTVFFHKTTAKTPVPFRVIKNMKFRNATGPGASLSFIIIYIAYGIAKHSVGASSLRSHSQKPKRYAERTVSVSRQVDRKDVTFFPV